MHGLNDEESTVFCSLLNLQELKSGSVTLGNFFCNLSHNFVAIQVGGRIAQCDIP